MHIDRVVEVALILENISSGTVEMLLAAGRVWLSYLAGNLWHRLRLDQISFTLRQTQKWFFYPTNQTAPNPTNICNI